MSNISRDGAKRTKRVVDRVERGYYNPPPGSRKGRSGGGPLPYAIHIKTGGAGISAASSVTQMTSGTVAVWIADESGALSDSGDTETVWNKSTTALSANKHGIAVLTSTGYVVDWIEC